MFVADRSYMAQGIEVLQAALDGRRICNARFNDGDWMEFRPYDHQFYSSSTGYQQNILIADLWKGQWIIELPVSPASIPNSDTMADRFECPHCERSFLSSSGYAVPFYCPFCGANSSTGRPLLWYEHVAHIRRYPDMHHLTTTEAAMQEVMQEYHRAIDHFGRFHSAHEGWAILNEEVDELWEEVKKPPKAVDLDAMRREAIQVAAMGLRFVLDVCSGKGE